MRTLKFKFERQKGELSVKYPWDGNDSGLIWIFLSGYVDDFCAFSLFDILREMTISLKSVSRLVVKLIRHPILNILHMVINNVHSIHLPFWTKVKTGDACQSLKA